MLMSFVLYFIEKSIVISFFDDNIDMKLFELYGVSGTTLAIVLVFTLIFIISISSLNIIIYSKIRNEDVVINLNVKFLFNLININRQIYPAEEKEKREKGKAKYKDKNLLLADDILSIYYLLSKVKLEEFYSDIEFGNTNIQFTSFIFILINTVYGNIINLIKPKKIYLNVKPNYLKDYLVGNVKLHLKPRIKDLIYLGRTLYSIYKKNKGEFREGDKDESDRVDQESYGDNC